MAIDLDAIKAKLSQLQNVGSKRDMIWKPEAGQQVIRIVPYQYDRSNPFQELYFNYELARTKHLSGDKTLSPISHGNPDPVVEFCEKLKSTGDRNDWQMGRKFEPKMRTYVPVLIRGKESEGVKFWGFGKTVYTELLGFIADPDYGDISDPVHGRDVVVEFIPSEGDKSYPKTKIRVKPNVTPMTEDRNVAEKVAKNQPKLEDLFPEPSYDDLKEALERWLSPENSEKETQEEATEEIKSETEAIEGVNKVEDVSAAFDELFNDDSSPF